jgi:hypothetical protein
MNRFLLAVCLGLGVSACVVPPPEEETDGGVVDAGTVTVDAGAPVDRDGGQGEPVDAGSPCINTAMTVHDCDTEAGYTVSSYLRPDPAGPELFIFGVYESSSTHSSPGQAHVTVSRTSPHILVLSSYVQIHWTVSVAGGAGLERVILNGYEEQTVAGVPQGIPVENRSGAGYVAACAYVWPADDQGCNTPGLVSGLRTLTSREVTGFAGCYRATEFTLSDGTLSCP